MMTSRNAEDKRAMRAILAKLYAVTSWYAYQDFRRVNPENRKKYDKKGNPIPPKSYTLSTLTLEARDHYKLAQQIIWSNESEEKIKGYLMRLRLSGDLDRILTWEEEHGRRKNNPWIDKEG